MKLLVTVIMALFLLAGTAAADTVDFTAVGSTPIDITAGNNPAEFQGYPLGSVKFLYDNYGSASDTAYLSSSGISGSTWGGLIFNFDQLASGVSFDFTVDGTPAPGDPNMMATFTSNGGANSNSIQVNGNSLMYGGPAFDQATFLFFPYTDASAGATPNYFSVSNVAFTSSVVPEPVSSALFLLGGGVLAFMRKKRAH